MMSIDIALIDINSAISAMNSRNGSGNRAAVASEMGVWGGFKCAYVHNVRRCSRLPRGSPAKCAELRDKIARLAQNCPFTFWTRHSRHHRSLRRHAWPIATMLTAPLSATGNRSA